MTTFHCDHCGLDKPKQEQGGTGYANTPFGLACYECCAAIDREWLRNNRKETLYLTKDSEDHYKITNWPGTLVIWPHHVKHTSASFFGRRGSRTYAWFSFEGQAWLGVNQGDMQILRCRRVAA